MKAALPLLAKAGLYDLQDFLRAKVEEQEARERNQLILRVKCLNPLHEGEAGFIQRIRTVRTIGNRGIREDFMSLLEAKEFVEGKRLIPVTTLTAHELELAGFSLQKAE